MEFKKKIFLSLIVWKQSNVLKNSYPIQVIYTPNELCSPMVRETGAKSQVESYQRLKEWYLMPPC